MSTTLFDQTLEPTAMPDSTALVEREVSPMTLLRDAVREGMTPDQLAVLVGLQRDMAADAARRAFAKAMHLAQKEMPIVVRDAKNKQTGSRFARLENVQQVAKPIYSDHGFSMSYGEEDCPIPNHKRTICDVTHDDGHMRKYHIDLPIDGVGPKGNAIGGMNAVQGCISTTSYGQRRLCCMVWNITIADEDNDGQKSDLPISEKQLVILNEWMEQKQCDLNRFLEWGECETLDTLPARKFEAAIDMLKRKPNK